MVAARPHVTAVGGTSRVNLEVTASLSGRAFSDYFPRTSPFVRTSKALAAASILDCSSAFFQAIVNGQVMIVPLMVFPGSCSSTYCSINVRPNLREWWHISYDRKVHPNMV
jgi:hypothetical protein